MKNLLLETIEYRIEKTRRGVWRRHLTQSGAYFAEYRSNARLFGLPLVHYTRGVCPETGRRVVAKGIIAVGRLAVGFVALGHASAGLLAIGQIGLGLLFGLGQASSGLVAIGQAALGGVFGMGQLATGQVAVGQLAYGGYALAQVGYGDYVWSVERADPPAVRYFQALPQRIARGEFHLIAPGSQPSPD